MPEQKTTLILLEQEISSSSGIEFGYFSWQSQLPFGYILETSEKVWLILPRQWIPSRVLSQFSLLGFDKNPGLMYI